mmetsp:Transcript_148115/g.376417  ORF Transcript_148115/g.376417 Transcript_148115/m.376417 type:complete len:237 (-) Transcript_148115:552-1262(-)
MHITSRIARPLNLQVPSGRKQILSRHTFLRQAYHYDLCTHHLPQKSSAPPLKDGAPAASNIAPPHNLYPSPCAASNSVGHHRCSFHVASNLDNGIALAKAAGSCGPAHVTNTSAGALSWSIWKSSVANLCSAQAGKNSRGTSPDHSTRSSPTRRLQKETAPSMPRQRNASISSCSSSSIRRSSSAGIDCAARQLLSSANVTNTLPETGAKSNVVTKPSPPCVPINAAPMRQPSPMK